MRGEDGFMVRRAGRWGWARLPALAAVLVVVERALLGELGSPVLLLGALTGRGDAWADPVVSVLALMGLLAEALIGYLLVVLGLRWLCVLPGAVGRLAGRMSLLITPATARRLLDLLVGGTLLVQATLATIPGPPGTPAGYRPSVPRPAVAISSTFSVPAGPAVAGDSDLAQRVLEPGPARPTPRRSAAPLPPWLGGGPSKAAPGYTVESGDTLWAIAAARLAPAERSVGRVHRYWRQVYRANRPVIGADPDMIHPGTRLEILPFRRERR